MLGVSSVVLRACTFPKPSPQLVGLWSFDETSGASEIFDDLEPADVPMSIVGNWADLTTGSIVQGVGGTSAYTDGSAYATIPANQAAHDLAALTISFYYQRHSAAAKQILLAAGDGTQAGDFSIEVLADGKLRGWHTGQDGALRFFEDGSGIIGTNLQVGTAHRIDLTLGPQGARIYLDGAELAAAAIFANRNSWNNARVKYLGRWTDGIQAPADGAFDRFRIWNQQLTNGEIDLLEPAQSIEIGGAPPAGDELSVPSLAEWLTNDDTDPPQGAITVTSESELTSALNSAAPGDTIVIDPPGGDGTIAFFDLPNGLTFPNGTAGNLITVMAARNKAVVVSACEDFAEARTPGSGFWTQSGLSQADIDKKIWRSVSTFSGGAQNMMGFWIEFDHPHQLLRYGSLTNLRATYGTADSPTNYATPGVHKDSDGRVYIRFQRPHPGKYSAGGKWSSNLWPGHPEAVNGSGQIIYPISEDPNDYVIHLFRAVTSSTWAFNRSSGYAGQYAQIGPGINSVGFGGVTRGRHSSMKRGTHLSWRLGIVAGNPTKQEDWFFDRCRFSSGFKFCRAEWKFGGPLEGIRDGALLGGTGSNDGLGDLYFRDCTIADFHEIGTAGASAIFRNFRFKNCTFYNILDDGFQTATGVGRYEIGYCAFINSAFGGSGTGGAEQQGDVWYFHHNIVDVRLECGSDWRGQPHPHFPYLAHSPDNNQPRKYYNNLFLWGPDTEQETHLGLSSNSDRPLTLSGTANAQEVFNNIIVRHGTKRYDTTTYSNTNAPDQTDYLCRYMNCNADDSNEFWDYNLWYKDVPSPVDGWGRQIRETRDVGEVSFASLSAFKANSLFTLSKVAGNLRGAYAPGFEGNSTDAKPTLPSLDNYPTARFQYRPSATSAVTVAAAASLSGANWWGGDGPAWGRTYFPWSGLAPSGYKGALEPNGTTITVGVQNP